MTKITIKIINLAFITFISSVISIKWEAYITSKTHLLARSKKISSLDGLEYFETLRDIDLSINQINDIHIFFTSNINITRLILDSNSIRNIRPLSRQFNLKELWMSENKINDLSSLSHLTNLKYLMLAQNQKCNIPNHFGYLNI
jgi:internalin A